MSGSHNTHARKAPSDAKRWLNCTSAISFENTFRLASRSDLDQTEKAELNGLIERFGLTFENARSVGYEERDDTVYNVEGTQAHDYAEQILTGQKTLFDIPEAFQDAVGIYTQECQRLAEEFDGFEPFIEAKVPLFYNKAETGTMDYAVVSQDKVVLVDYKHGAGIYVEVFENPQLAIYAMSFLQMLEDDGYYAFGPETEIIIKIAQPRHHAGEPIREWVLSFQDLTAFCAEIQRVHDTEDADTVFAPGEDTCQWCRCKAFCGARLHHLAQGLPYRDGGTEADLLADMPIFDEKETPEPLDRIGRYTAEFGVVDVPTMVKIWSNRKSITAFLNDIEAHLTRLTLSGEGVAGLKIVMGREGNTAWVDEEAAERMLENQKITKEERTVSKVISPTKAKALLGDKINETKKKNPDLSPRLVRRWHELTARSPGKKVIALEGDKRPAVEHSLADMETFEVED